MEKLKKEKESKKKNFQQEPWAKVSKKPVLGSAFVTFALMALLIVGNRGSDSLSENKQKKQVNRSAL